MHALIEFLGKQFKVEEGSSLKVPYIKEKVGSKVSVDKILYLEDGKTRTVGKPFVKGKKIDAEVVSHGRGRKVVVFKFKRRKGYQVKNTHRDDYTILKFGKLSAQKKSTLAKQKKNVDDGKVVTKKATTKSVASKKTEVKKNSAKKEKA